MSVENPGLRQKAYMLSHVCVCFIERERFRTNVSRMSPVGWIEYTRTCIYSLFTYCCNSAAAAFIQFSEKNLPLLNTECETKVKIWQILKGKWAFARWRLPPSGIWPYICFPSIELFDQMSAVSECVAWRADETYAAYKYPGFSERCDPAKCDCE